jgi:hypothetical protein
VTVPERIIAIEQELALTLDRLAEQQPRRAGHLRLAAAQRRLHQGVGQLRIACILRVSHPPDLRRSWPLYFCRDL